MESFYAVSNSDYSVYSDNTRTSFQNIFNKDDIFHNFKNKNFEIGIKKIFFDKKFPNEIYKIDYQKIYNIYLCSHSDRLTYLERHNFNNENFNNIYYLVHNSNINLYQILLDVWEDLHEFHYQALKHMETVFYNPFTNRRTLPINLSYMTNNIELHKFLFRITFYDKSNFFTYKIKDEEFLRVSKSFTNKEYAKLMEYKIVYVCHLLSIYDSKIENRSWLEKFTDIISFDTIRKIRFLESPLGDEFFNFNSLFTCKGMKIGKYYEVINILNNSFSLEDINLIDKYFSLFQRLFDDGTLIKEEYKKEFQYEILITTLHMISIMFFALQNFLQNFLFLNFNLTDVLTEEEINFLNNYEKSLPLPRISDKLVNFLNLNFEKMKKNFFLNLIEPKHFEFIKKYLYLTKYHIIQSCIKFLDYYTVKPISPDENINEFLRQVGSRLFVQNFFLHFHLKNKKIIRNKIKYSTEKIIVQNKNNLNFEIKQLILPYYEFYHIKIYNSKKFALNKINSINIILKEYLNKKIQFKQVKNIDKTKFKSSFFHLFSNQFSIMLDPLLAFKLGFHINETIGYAFLLKDVFNRQIAKEIMPLKTIYIPPSYIKIKSNIIYPVIWSSYKDRCMDYFVLKENENYIEYEYQLPSYHKINSETIEDLQINLTTLDDKKLEALLGNPTCILFYIQEQKMKNYFNIFLSSSDKFSQKMYPNNNMQNFRIELPHRISFNSEWKVLLKSITIPNYICNIYEEYCTFRVKTLDTNGYYVKKIPNQYISSNDKFIDLLNSYCSDIFINFKIKNDKVEILNSSQENYIIEFHSILAKMLGFNVESEDSNYVLSLSAGATLITDFSIDLFLAAQKMIIVCCDLVSPSYFGSIKSQILKLVHIDEIKENNIHINFKDYDYHSLIHRSFSSIGIKLYDMTFKELKFDEFKLMTNQDVVLSLLFYR